MSEIALTRAFAPHHFQANPLRIEREFGGVVKMAGGIVSCAPHRKFGGIRCRN
ncbi:hypothetical protein DENSPDRAFT_837572, partial [Dentipellis sp. KUC8613]